MSGYFSNNFVNFILFLTLLFSFLLHTNLLNEKLFWGFWLIVGYFCYISYNEFLILFFLLLTFVLIKINFFKKETILLFKKSSFILSFLGSFIILRFFLLYFSYNGENPNKILKRIKKQKEVKIIFTLNGKNLINKNIKIAQLFFVAQSMDTEKLFFGFHQKGAGARFIMFNKKSKKILINENIQETSDNIYIDCKKPFLYVGDHGDNKIYNFNQNNIKSPKKIIKILTNAFRYK